MPKKNTDWIMPTVLGVVLVALLAGALALYNRYEGKALDTASAPTADSSATTSATTSGEASSTTTPPGGTGIPGVNAAATVAVPDFTMTDANATPVTLSSLKGKPTIINFWATWCPPCREELDSFQKMYDQYGADVHFVMLNILTQGDTVASVKQFCTDKGYTFPVYFDEEGEGLSMFGVTGIPQTVFLDTQGLSYGTVVGGMPESMLARAITLLTSGK